MCCGDHRCGEIGDVGEGVRLVCGTDDTNLFTCHDLRNHALAGVGGADAGAEEVRGDDADGRCCRSLASTQQRGPHATLAAGGVAWIGFGHQGVGVVGVEAFGEDHDGADGCGRVEHDLLGRREFPLPIGCVVGGVDAVVDGRGAFADRAQGLGIRDVDASTVDQRVLRPAAGPGQEADIDALLGEL